MAKNRNLLKEANEKAKAGDLGGAIATFSLFLQTSPNDPRAPKVHAHLGEMYLGVGRLPEAGEHLERALEHNPDSVESIYRLSQVRSFEGKTDEAFALLDRLLALEPDHESGLARRAALLQYLGRVEEAAAVIDDAWARGLANPNLAHAFAGIAHSLKRRPEAIDRIKPYAKDRSVPIKTRVEMNFQLGRLFDGEGDYDAAWECYELGNRLSKPIIDPAGVEKAVDEIIETYTRAAIEKLERCDTSAERAVLIIGMPRSGTTLIEQVLGAHSEIEVGGELHDLPKVSMSIPGRRVGGVLPSLNRIRGNALRRANKSYLDALDGVSTNAARVTDKLPMNFRTLGLMPSLLPGARVIHCTRDPMDTCLSCYFRNFVGQHAMLTDLEWIGIDYRCYRKLMKHWETELEGLIELTEAPYEQAVNSFEPEARRLVDFVGLDFDDSCLHFDKQRRMSPTLEPEQAGQNVYASSLGRWRNYEKHLGPLIKALGPEFAPKS
jgi:tetratricopeptide (TPR) repeat protein